MCAAKDVAGPDGFAGPSKCFHMSSKKARQVLPYVLPEAVRLIPALFAAGGAASAAGICGVASKIQHSLCERCM
eukprot:1156318-Pelagomonas_calceolata.AAC.4